jgi:hypothetical protein
MAEETPIKKADFQQEIVKMAAEDKEFADKLLANPKEALREAIGFEPPPGVDVKVLQEDPTCLYIVLPATFAEEGQELGDAELEAVAGGAMAMQMQTFTAGKFAQRFQGERMTQGAGRLPDGRHGVRLSWG